MRDTLDVSYRAFAALFLDVSEYFPRVRPAPPLRVIHTYLLEAGDRGARAFDIEQPICTLKRRLLMYNVGALDAHTRLSPAPIFETRPSLLINCLPAEDPSLFLGVKIIPV